MALPDPESEAQLPAEIDAELTLPVIVRRYATGESVQTLATEAGVHRATLYRWMLAGIGDKQYHALVTNCLVQRVADADAALADAREPCDIARAREQARFARMDLERRRPHLYGQQARVTVEHAGDLGEQLREGRERMRKLRDRATEQAPAALLATTE